MNGEILNAMARLGGQYASAGIFPERRDDWPPEGVCYAHDDDCPLSRVQVTTTPDECICDELAGEYEDER